MLRSMMIGPLALVACTNRSEQRQRPPTPSNTVRPLPPTLIQLSPTQVSAAPDLPEGPTASPESLDSGWQRDGSDLELRHLQIERADSTRVPLVVVRLQPSSFSMRVAYDPDSPRLLRNWLLTNPATLTFNGGFFLESYQPVGLIVSDGQALGESYTGFGGMLALHSDGNLSLRALRDQPYEQGEDITQAIQSFPMLVFPGGVYADFEDNGNKARRTALAFDQDGRLLIIVAPGHDLSLRELADWLLSSDLRIDRALNLDGGPSTGLFLKSAALNEQIDSLGLLPIVLFFNRK